MKNPAILGNIAVQPPRALAHIWTREDTRGTPPSMVTHQDPPLSPGHAVFKLTYLSSHDYKHLYFESDAATVSEIVLKVSPVWPLTQGWEGGVPPGLVSGQGHTSLSQSQTLQLPSSPQRPGSSSGFFTFHAPLIFPATVRSPLRLRSQPRRP